MRDTAINIIRCLFKRNVIFVGNNHKRNMRTSVGSNIKILILAIIQCQCLTWLELVAGPRLQKADEIGRIGCQMCDAQNLVEGFGYPFEAHEVISQSGYILSLHRIPSGLKRKKSSSARRPVALIQHGLMAASDTWLFRGPKMDLPYVLADAGYDVWLSNMRGNVYSRAHQTLNPDRDPKYWDFSLEEVAYDDFPVMFDYILNLTKQENLFLLGHSIGSTLGVILCSLRPEYNSKIKLHLGLAPVIYIGHTITLSHRLLLTPMIALAQTALTNQIFNIFPRRPYFGKLLETICRDGMPTQELCLFSVFLVVGTDRAQFNTSSVPLAVSFYPAGTSIYLAQHTLQMYLYGNFAPFNYENKIANFKKYNTTVPPPYNLSMVTHPISLHYGEGDALVTKEDVELTAKKLPNPVGTFPVPYTNFNHMDFMWGIDAKNLLYDTLIVIMDKYR